MKYAQHPRITYPTQLRNGHMPTRAFAAIGKIADDKRIAPGADGLLCILDSNEAGCIGRERAVNLQLAFGFISRHIIYMRNLRAEGACRKHEKNERIFHSCKTTKIAVRLQGR